MLLFLYQKLYKEGILYGCGKLLEFFYFEQHHDGTYTFVLNFFFQVIQS